MAYDDKLADRVRTLLAGNRKFTEKKIIGGGLGFLLDDKMFAGVVNDELMVRVAADDRTALLKRAHVRPLTMKGKPTAGFILVAPPALRRTALQKWVDASVKVVSTPPAPPPATAAPRTRKLLAALRADPKLARVVEDLEARQAAGGPKKFGSNGLKVNGKLFALFTQGTLVVKLPKDRVAALVASKVGTPFDPGHGRLMREWLTVTSPKASWLSLTKEAHAFVRGR